MLHLLLKFFIFNILFQKLKAFLHLHNFFLNFSTLLFLIFIDIFVFVSILSISQNIDSYQYLSLIFPSLSNTFGSVSFRTRSRYYVVAMVFEYPHCIPFLKHYLVTKFHKCAQDKFWEVFLNVIMPNKSTVKRLNDQFSKYYSDYGTHHRTICTHSRRA